MRSGNRREALNWSAARHRVLYLRYDRIGDMVLATGIIKAIALAQPTVKVDVLASVGNAAVLRGNPHVDAIIRIDKKRPWSYLTAILRMRRRRYDAVIDPMVWGPSLTSMLLMWASRAHHRIGIGGRGNDSAFTVLVNRIHEAVHYIDQSAAMLAAFGVDTTAWGIWRPELFLTAAELREGEARWHSADALVQQRQAVRHRLVVNVSASSPGRYWPDDRFTATLCRIRSRFPDLSILIIGSPQDAARMARIGRGAGVAVTHMPHYRQMMAVVATSDFVFTPDTSVTHIASAFGKPAVVMFVGGGGSYYGPYGTAGRIVSTDGPSLDSVDVGTVIQALGAALAAWKSSGNSGANELEVAARGHPGSFQDGHIVSRGNQSRHSAGKNDR